MANNLRVLSVDAISNVVIKASFTDALSPNIGVDNVSISSQTPGVPDPQVVKVRVINNVLEITTLPLTSLAAYFATFTSTTEVPFQSLNATAILFADGVGNKQFFLGPLESTNVVKEYFLNYLQDNVYNPESGTLLASYLDVLSTFLSTALYDVRQARNENYISLTITDEKQTRGATAFDHLNQEGAYEIIRVGKTPTDAVSEFSLSVDEFTTDPVSLLQSPMSESLQINSIDKVGTFNINSFILNLSKRFAIKLTSVTFTYTNGHLPYVYDISKFGYQILDQKYDSSYAFQFVSLADNQIKLSDKILEDAAFSSDSIFQVQVSYDYKDSGRVLDTTSVGVDAVLTSGREVLPPLLNVFNLKHAPVVNSSNTVGTIGDIEFVDQNALTVLNAKHPAFLHELQFRLDFLPSNPGEYSVDYSTGTVYVYGADINNDGTGATPPLAIYLYRLNFKENIDWVIDTDSNDLAAIDTGSLVGLAAEITFNYEQVLAQGIDYKAQVHQEVLDERIGNNLLALNAFSVANAPITDIFRVYNETSGEIYRVIRWVNDKVYFAYNNPPVIEEFTGERATFEVVSNEVMFVSSVAELTMSANVFTIELNNDNIMAQSEDCIGASFNSSVSFSNNIVFANELYFDTLQTPANNLLRLDTVGEYLVDYKNGVVYVVVSSGQDFNIGTVSYKRGYVSPLNPHITSVADIYYRINTLSAKEKSFAYLEFDDGFIVPASFDAADEQLLSSDVAAPYVNYSNQIGAFIDTNFVHAVSNSIQFVRGIYENDDLLYNSKPLNFAETATFDNKSITVAPIEIREYHTVEFDGTNYFVLLNTGLNYASTNISINIDVIRISDSQQLWGTAGTIVLGNLIKLVLPITGSPHNGDSVVVSYSYTLNDLSHVIVDYNKGEYYIDYNALTDEIIVSYEYGNNALDFRESTAINANEDYYVSYKVGALRDALLKNFGSLIDIDVLNTFDVNFGRERYRDAITAAMHSFAQGPTVQAIKNIAQTISHMPADIDESVFETWSLGNSLLNPHEFEVDGNIALIPTRFGNGALIDKPDQEIRLPVISNIKLDEGTFETWIRPSWDGLDNLAELRITPLKDGYLVPELNVFIGALEYHPTYQVDNKTGQAFFILNKDQNVDGIPNKNKNGLYFYYAPDASGSFNRWFVEVIDGYSDGYASKKYSISLATNGKFYDVKSTLTSQPTTTRITSGTNHVVLAINSTSPNEGITFVADLPHYIVDFGENESKNRFSIFKDESGYLNFRVYDRLKNSYNVSTSVSSWRHGDIHHVAASWKLNNEMGRDELHLFIDGFEVPNIIKYGDRIKPYLHEKFRTVNPEEVVGLVNKNIVSQNDITTIIGSNQVVSSINFSQYGINIGDTLYIEETGFEPLGYSITNVNGNTLTLAVAMPFTITDGKFSVNKLSFDVMTEIDVFPNFAVSLLHSYYDAQDLTTTVNSNVVHASSTNFITRSVQVGDLLRINSPTFENHYTIVGVSATSLTVNDKMPANASSLHYSIYHPVEEEIPGTRALQPAYELTKSTDGYYTNVLTLRNNAKVNDMVLIRTLGMNHRRVKRRYYVWSNNSNILKTKLPAPISLDEAKVSKVILGQTAIGAANATLIGGIFVSNDITTDRPSNNFGGRTLSVSIQGDNIDFSTPVSVAITGTAIDGYGSNNSVTETLIFAAPGAISTSHYFAEVDHVNVNTKPIRTTSNSAIVDIKEQFPITHPENTTVGTTTAPAVARYSYQVSVGNTLFSDGYMSSDGYSVSDPNNFFSSSLVNNYLVIHSPPAVAGYYTITGVSDDHKALTLANALGTFPLPAFTDGYYEVLNTTDFRSGLQNGYFTFEHQRLPGQPYYLTQGLYELDYYTYLNIPFDLTSTDMYIGSDMSGKHQLHGSIDELQILNVKLTDTRIGETAPNAQRTITKEFNSVKPSKADITSLVLTHFDTLPPVNEADIYRFAENNVMQAGEVINDNFKQSISLVNSPLVVDNYGILDTKKEATIEFWVNPVFDTQNDPTYRFYFDASGAVQEQVVSTNNLTIQLHGAASQILFVKQEFDGQNVDYFAGGTITNGGTTLSLHRALPNQNTSVIVSYIPKGLQGDRISLFKDPAGYLNFSITASGTDYVVRAPIFWQRNSWHRVKASYKINSGTLLDEMHLLIDGYEKGDILFGSGMLFGQWLVYGSSFSGPNLNKYNIRFADPINQFTIGSDMNAGFSAHCLIDNLRISNISRPIYQPFGEPLDPNYSSNLDMVFPITEDLYTTLLLNFDTLITKNDDFAILNSRTSGLADFSINIRDSFGIIDDNDRVKEVLEALIKSFKPANSRAFINYL
jgi:hypothetical protein